MGSRENRRRKSKQAEENVRGAEKKKKSNRLMWFGSLVLLILIVVTFVGAPVITRFSDSERIIFGYYNGKPIEFKPGNYFSRQRDYIADQMQETAQNENVEWQIYSVWKQAYDRAVIHTALIDMARESGMMVTDEKLDLTIVEEGPYTVNGEFNENLYRSASNAEKQADRQYMLESILAGTVRQDILTPIIPDAEIEFIKSMASIERRFRFITYSFSEYPTDLVADYGRQNRDTFRTMRLSRITIKSGEKDAETILGRLRDDPTLFGELARTQSQDSFAEKGGEMGDVTFHSAESYFKETEDAEHVFNLKEGEISRLIDAPSGWTIYRCDAEATYPDFTSEEALAEVRSYMNRFERGVIEDYLYNLAEEFITDATDRGFESAALIRGKLYKETDPFPVNYGNLSFQFYGTSYPVFQGITVDGSPSQELRGASTNRFFLSEIHSLSEDSVSDPLILNDSVVVMQCTEIRDVPEEELQGFEMFYPAAAQYWYDQDLNRIILASDEFEDNFNTEFSRLFLNREE